MSDRYTYPRRALIRQTMRLLGRSLAPFMAQVTITGKSNFPARGPLIVVGNHTGAMEVVLMTIYSPWLIEYLGSIDIPHEPYIAAFINAYGYIPVFRGKTSTVAIQAALDILKQGGVLGLFPEGGIWEPEIRQAQRGVAWLSYKSGAPILPIGFRSTRGALKAMLRFQRPELSMHVGLVIPAVKVEKGKKRKDQLQTVADSIVDRIWELVPDADADRTPKITDESFRFKVEVFNRKDQLIEIPPSYTLQHGEAFSKFVHRATLFNNLRDNLQLPVQPLKLLHTDPGVEEILSATSAILTYLQAENPHYFTYRYGQEEGQAMHDGILELDRLAQWVKSKGYRLAARSIRRYRSLVTGECVLTEIPEETDKW
jgi:1-acyl-sn-glycerol-3-phosphate acyltransferase